MSIYEIYESNTDLENNGVWIDTISDPEEFLIASADNQKFNNRVTLLYRPRRKDIQNAQKAEDRGIEVSEELEKFIQDKRLQAFCEFVLLDWKNVTDRKGKPIPYSVKAAYTLLSSPGMHRLKEAIFAEADRQGNFAKKQEEESEKNLKKTSSGT